VNFHGEKRSNQTHESQSDPEALLARKSKGKEAKLSYSGNLLVENRHGLIVDSRVWEATGTAERYAALAMLYLTGEGVSKSCEQARLLLKAAEEGSVEHGSS
jgi:hypothetical protein